MNVQLVREKAQLERALASVPEDVKSMQVAFQKEIFDKETLQHQVHVHVCYLLNTLFPNLPAHLACTFFFILPTSKVWVIITISDFVFRM